MSLRTIQRLAMASVLALGGITAAGCDDENGDEDGDDGAPDGGDGQDGTDGDGGDDGNPDGADGDGGSDEPVLCGPANDTECAPTDTGWNNFILDACCDTDEAKTCGAIVPDLEGSPLQGCFAKGQPGNTSESCSDLFDQLDGVEDDGFTTTLSGAVVTFPGCCTPSGLCGVNVDTFSLGAGADLQVGFGCIPLSKFDLSGDDADGGVPDAGTPADGGAEEEAILPYCVPEKATDDMACPPNMQIIAGPNLCDVLPESGLPFIPTEEVPCTGETQTPAWVCAARGWPLIATGELPVEADHGDCLQFLPDIVRGCGIGQDREGCVPNVPETLTGCVDMESTEQLRGVLTQLIAAQPDYACGCGATVKGTGNCIPNTVDTICGGFDVDALPADNADRRAALARVPDFLCGCGAGPRSSLCLANTATTVCGTFDVEAPPAGTEAQAAAIMAGVPEFLCGCSAPFVTALCLPNTAASFCGTLPVEVKGHPALEAIPDYLCGCGNGVRWAPSVFPNPKVRCLDNVGLVDNAAGDTASATAICGLLDVPLATASLPNSWCGCGDDATTYPGSCFPHTSASACGQVPVCTPVGEAGDCPAGICLDTLPAGGGDNIGDACGAP